MSLQAERASALYSAASLCHIATSRRKPSPVSDCRSLCSSAMPATSEEGGLATSHPSNRTRNVGCKGTTRPSARRCAAMPPP